MIKINLNIYTVYLTLKQNKINSFIFRYELKLTSLGA